ncbi:MAG: alanine racemase [Rhodocyclaceae bacterium]|nr:alanine racemase [Rhodocyclaceae bacterium]
MPRPLTARIDHAALRHNLALARALAPQSKLMAVVKADGYGHGLLRVARALRSADAFAVLTLDDAVALRDAGHVQPILLLQGFYEASELPEIAERGLAIVIHEASQLEALLASQPARPIDVHLKMNSGMNRLGLPPHAYADAAARLRAWSGLGSLTLMTHFATADEPAGIDWQMERFHAAAGGLQAPLSLANSAALVRHQAARAEWVRPGIMLYGVAPSVETAPGDLDLRPAMTLTSRIISVQNLGSGEWLGYGGTFTAERPTRVGVVACGYGDGYPRHAGTGTPILVDGVRTRTLGRLSMDSLYADITDLPQAGVGSAVTLWGEGLPAQEVASAAGTIAYQLLCGITRRVPVVETGVETGVEAMR